MLIWCVYPFELLSNSLQSLICKSDNKYTFHCVDPKRVEYFHLAETASCIMLCMQMFSHQGVCTEHRLLKGCVGASCWPFHAMLNILYLYTNGWNSENHWRVSSRCKASMFYLVLVAHLFPVRCWAWLQRQCRKWCHWWICLLDLRSASYSADVWVCCSRWFINYTMGFNVNEFNWIVTHGNKSFY